MPLKAGIPVLQGGEDVNNKKNGKQYIGQSIDIDVDWCRHFRAEENERRNKD